MQGKLSEVKARFRGEEYLLEFRCAEDAALVRQAFPSLLSEGKTTLLLSGGEEAVYPVLTWLGEKRISPVRLQRQEPSLESLFLEVIK
jgi:ABC-2 type transport system ATP-binding protein